MHEIFGATGWVQPIALASEAGPSIDQPSGSGSQVVPQKKSRTTVSENYLKEIRESRNNQLLEKENRRKSREEKREEHFQQLIAMKERHHKEKLDLIKQLLKDKYQ